ncbi:MAG TPA: response regulator [bacterium]|nr:response regulator [bacterium]
MTKILLIEPNEAHSKLIRDRIEAGIDRARVDETPNLKKGLDLLTRRAYDCILTDTATPEESDIRLIQQLKKAAGTVPIIVVTGRTDDGRASAIIRNGAADYVLKSRATLEAIPELVRKNILKSQVKHPLLVPANVLRRILDEIEKNVSRDVRAKIRKIRKNTEKLLSR